MAPAAVTAVKDLGRSGLQSAHRTACRCGRRLLAAALPAPRSPTSDEGGKTRPAALEGRWSLTALPKASAPPNPLLPSEIKYSASLVRGQAVTHAVLGTLLFITGVLGTRHTGGGGTSSAGVWCGVAAIVCAVCGLMAHRLWYRNWAIKSFLLASTAAAVLCVLGLGLTSYFAVLASYQQPFPHHPGYRYADGRFSDGGATVAEGGGVNGTAETSGDIKDMYFELPPPPRTSQSLLGNLIVGLCAELLVSVWSLVVAWRGVQAEEFTVSRREELVKEIIARAPASHAMSRTTATVEADTSGSMPLAALYHLLQAHPELLTSKLQWGAECPHGPSSHASMDYRERVSRYLSNTLQPEGEIERNPSPSSITSLTKRQRASSAPDEDHEAQRPAGATSRRRSRSKSEHRAKSKERRRKTAEPEVAEGGYSSSTSSPVNSSASPAETASDSSPSSTLTRLETSDTSDTLDSQDIVEDGRRQSQSLVLGLKTLSPLSSHVINPSEMMPCRKGKIATMQSKTTANVENEVAKHAPTIEVAKLPPTNAVAKPAPTREVTKPAPTIESDSEYNVSFVHTMDKPPPLPKKEYAKPTLVINEKLRQEVEYMNKEQVSKSRQSSSSAGEEKHDSKAAQHHRQKLLKELVDRNENNNPSLSSKASVVSEKSNTNTLLRRKKDKKPPPVPDKLHTAPKGSDAPTSVRQYAPTSVRKHAPTSVRQDAPTSVRQDAPNIKENKNPTIRKELKDSDTELDLDNRIYSNTSNVSHQNTRTAAGSNEIYVNIPAESLRDGPDSRKENDSRSCNQPLAIEIRPYENKTIVIKRDDRGKHGV